MIPQTAITAWRNVAPWASIDQIEQASQMPILLKPMDIKKYNEFYKKLSRDLFLKIKPEDK